MLFLLRKGQTLAQFHARICPVGSGILMPAAFLLKKYMCKLKRTAARGLYRSCHGKNFKEVSSLMLENKKRAVKSGSQGLVWLDISCDVVL